MAENTSDKGKTSMEEVIDMVKTGPSKKGNEKILLRYIGGLLALTLLFAAVFGFLQYSLSQQLTEMATYLTNLELRISGLEIQQAELRGKTPTSVIVNEVETLSSKVGELEKRMTSSQANKIVSVESPKQAKSTAVKKRYHEVTKGETLYRISKQYAITVDELCRLNKISPNQPIEVGQKLLVSK